MPKRLAEAVRDHQARHGEASCPFESGAIGNLADNECKHGALPDDKKRICECFPKRKVGKR